MKRVLCVTAGLLACSTALFAYRFDFVTVNDVVQKVRDRYRGAECYTAQFTISTTRAGKKTVQTGVIRSKQPDYMLVQFSNPAGQKIVSDGRMLWMYIPSLNVVAEQDLRSEHSSIFSSGVGTGLSRLFDRYHYRFDAKEQPAAAEDGKKYYTLHLTQKESRSGYRTFKLWINEDFIITKAIGETSNGGTVEIEFKAIDLTQNFPTGMFKFEMPPNARIIKNPMIAEE